MYTLFTDGGSRGNPGLAACACVILDGEKLIDFKSEMMGLATNNQAEYSGLQLGINLLKKHGIKKVICYLDSELVVKQLKGEYKIKEPNIAKLAAKIKKEIELFDSIEFEHVPRAQNWIADKLVNVALDANSKKL